MITLNLISKERRAWLEEIRRFALVKLIAIIVFSTLILSVSYLYAIQYILNNRLVSVQEESNTVKAQLPHREGTTPDEQIQDLNARIGQLEQLQQENLSLAVLVNDLGNSITGGIILDTISINPVLQKLQIKGTASSRTTLLDFQNALMALPYIEDINTPLSTFTQRENIDFNYDITLLVEKVKDTQ